MAYGELPEKGNPYEQQREQSSRRIGERYKDRLAVAHQNQMGAAEQVYAGAGRVGELSAGVMRGQALQPAMADLGSGNALAARNAIYGAAQASAAAGMRATGMSSADRLAAGGMYMDAQAQRAAHEQALMDAYMQREAARQDAIARANAAIAAKNTARKEATMRLVGSMVGAGASAGAAASSYGKG